MMKRNLWNRLAAWKQRKQHPLITSGLWKAGKTYIVILPRLQTDFKLPE